MIISFIVAMDRNRVIGRDNDMPWHLPSDLEFFKRTTMHKPIVMGRKTHESIGRALPGRTNIIVTRDTHYQATGCLVAHSLPSAVVAAGSANEIFIIGGATLYRQALPIADRIYLTEIDTQVEGDTYFPELMPGEWREICYEASPDDERDEFTYRRRLLQRA
jgi:dihydrofolate reductase